MVETRIFPNPSNDGNITIYINGNKNEFYNIIVLSLEGKVVYESDGLNPGNNEINTKLSKGLYFIRIFKDETNISTQKLMIK